MLSPSTIHLRPPTSPSENPANTTYIIYHITGNPGLIAYYDTFLTHLYGLLTSRFSSSSTPHPSLSFQVFGRSLSGFEVDGRVSKTGKQRDNRDPPYSLEEQIEDCEAALIEVVDACRGDNGAKDVRVVLMGHSVGSYILLEIIRRIRGRVREDGIGIRIVGGVCLFPTVTHIAKSASGSRSSWLLNLPSFARFAAFLVKALTLLLPSAVLSILIQTLMSFPSDAAHVTTAFVKSRHGIRQALHMARDEMLTITTDRWDDEIWGAEQPSTHRDARPALRFLFAKEDHWVANETRDELMRVRGMDGDENEVWKPKMEVDEEEGWPHGFCIKHSIPVAERVSGYIEDIIRSDLQRS